MTSLHDDLFSKRFKEDRFYEVMLVITEGVARIAGMWERGTGFGDEHYWKIEPVDGRVYQSLIQNGEFYVGFWFYTSGDYQRKIMSCVEEVVSMYHRHLSVNGHQILQSFKTDLIYGQRSQSHRS